jgi:Flp pilus assembly protein TadD
VPTFGRSWRFFTGVIAGLTTIWLERHYVGAQGVDWQLSFLERCVIAGRALWFYAQKIVWPMDLMFIYPRWRIDASDPGQLVFPVAGVGVLLALWLTRRRIGSGPLTAVLLFAGTLFPALGFFDVFPMRYSFVADHFQYLASIALITLGLGVIARLVEERAPGRAGAARAAAMVIVVVLATLTWRQCYVYADHETLWRETVRKDPASWMGHTSLGALLGQRGVLTEAETHYREAVRLNPNFAIAHANLGGLLANQGRFTEAIPHLREAVRLEPRSLTNHVSLGRALMYSGQTDEAIVWFRRAVAGWPEDADARALLEAALAAQSSTPNMRR